MKDDYYNCHTWDTDGFPGEFIYGDNVYISDEYMGERWKRTTVSDDHWVSDKGRAYGPGRHGKGGFIYGSPVGRCDHRDVSIKRNGIRIHKYMHQLVEDAFVPNRENYTLIRHLDDDPSNNALDNLARGTSLDNTRDCIDHGRFRYFTAEDREKAMQKRRMPIVAYNVRSGERIEFISQGEAARELGVSQGEISDVINGRRRHVNGWLFAKCWEDLPDPDNINIYRGMKRPLIMATNIDTGEQIIFRGLTEAAAELGIHISSISTNLSGKTKYAKRWFFEYMDEEEYDE